jgi:hypothetical protein
MAPLTAQAIAAGAETLFQATFTVADLLVKVDILTKTANAWHLIEVKSSTQYKRDQHLPDIAFQWVVLQQAGLNITQASLMHLNRDCRHPDLTNLFTLTDVTDEVQAALPQVVAHSDIMRQIVAHTTMPHVPIGRHCNKPYACPYYDHCWQGIEDFTIYHIPYLKPAQEQQLEADGIRYMSDIPPEFALGDKRGLTFIQRINQQQISINRDTIGTELAALVYPLFFFDFETIDYAIPIFTGCQPYQQTPFQYSCHILDADGTLTHCDYLHTSLDDPRPPLIQALLEHIAEAGSIIVYHAPFEKARLQELAQAFPEHAPHLLAIIDRLWDQLNIFKKHYRDYRFGRSNSLKSVLPIIAPALSYQTLAIQNGQQAQVTWEEMILCQDPTHKTQLATHLRAYCHLDTLAMVEIHHSLLQLLQES